MTSFFLTLLLAKTISGDLPETKGLILIEPFRQGKTEIDNTLEKNQAVYTFHFKGYYNTDKEWMKSVSLKVDNCDKLTPKLDSLGNCTYTMVPGKHTFEFYANKCSVVKSGEVKINPQTRNEFKISFQDTTAIIVVCKPVIYLYPTETTPVNIKIDVKGKLGFTWPVYNDEWTVLAHNNGTIEDEGTAYNYLFWDGEMQAYKLNYDHTKGSVVAKQNLIAFLENSLTQMGFTTKEMQDFITYWAPKILANNANYIHFLVNDTYEQIAGVDISPKPKNMLRVYMLWHKVNEENSLNCTPQAFSTIKRDGFTYVEWGGSEVPEEKIP